MRVNPLTGGTSFGGREGRKARRKQASRVRRLAIGFWVREGLSKRSWSQRGESDELS